MTHEQAIEQAAKQVFDCASGFNCAIDDGLIHGPGNDSVKHDIESAISHLQDALRKIETS